MSFIIRTVKRRPNGSESIREQRFEKDTLSMGRGPDNDIVIPDLSLGRNHARIIKSKDKTFHLILSAMQSALVNGKLIVGRKIPLSSPTVFEIGHAHFKFEQSADNEICILWLEQKNSEATKPKKTLEPEIFNLNSVLPSKRLLSWIFSISILAIFLALPILVTQNPTKKSIIKPPIQADLSWNSGKISLMHANLKSNCQACHAKPFVSVRDIDCANCHLDTKNHAKMEDLLAAKPKPKKISKALNQISETFNRPIGRCASCHVEHNEEKSLIPNSQKLCVDCHRQISKTLTKTQLSDVSDFGTNHPQFSPTFVTTPKESNPVLSRVSLDDNPKGYSGLKFSHKQHMEKGKAVDQMASKLPKKFGFADGVNCTDCHRPETGGGLFEPVSMKKDCAMCHALGFEKTNLGKNTNYLRTLRHGEPEEVIATMRDFYLAKTLANLREINKNTTTRRRPGRAAQIRNINARELAFKQADNLTAASVKAIFSKGGTCYDCHVIQKPPQNGSLNYRVAPISIDDQFYPQSQFKHSTHQVGKLSCASCHKAKESNSSSDILLPKIKICRSCHIGEESYRAGGAFAKGTIPTTCLTCHTYHDGKHASLMVKKQHVTSKIDEQTKPSLLKQ